MARSISVIIPLFNGTGTIEACLAAACASPYPDYEVVVVDDASTDNSVEMIERYPCRLIRLNAHSGASKARNTGAQHSRGETLFFIDADCVMLNNTLDAVAAASTEHRGMVVGGTYTAIPYDNRFFSTFQSIFVHYNETRSSRPDYIATHAMVIKADTFRKMRGFREDFLPILEDVEFSHRLRNAGVGLVMDPRIRVQHIFNYTLARSLKNAYRKAFYWTRYSLHNRDLFRDSGTASLGLKVNVAAFSSSMLLLFLSFILGISLLRYLAILPILLSLFMNRGLIAAFFSAKGSVFGIFATLYYILGYPVAVGTGALAGMITYMIHPSLKADGNR